MESKGRIIATLETHILDSSSFGFEPFYLTDLLLPNLPKIEIRENLRLGHKVEKIVSDLIKASTNYKILYENIQIKEGNQTIGEIDFILEEISSKQRMHVEVAYKFYLFDPSLSSAPFHNWIGPNRNDSLKDKVTKLKNKQFPLLYKPQTKAILAAIDTVEIKQKLCLLTSLYVPYQTEVLLEPEYQKAVKGYYIKHDLFKKIVSNNNYFYMPAKKDWGINPANNKVWFSYQEVEMQLTTAIQEKQAVLCWEKNNDTYSEYFIVWW